MIINIFGQPGSGKTTLAEKLSSDLKIRYPDHQIINIDGDFVRKATNNLASIILKVLQMEES